MCAGGHPASSSNSNRRVALNGVASGRFDDDGVAGGERRRDLVRHHVQRRVERRDAAHDAARHADRERHAVRLPGRRLDRHHLAGHPLRLFGGDDERLDGAIRLDFASAIGMPASAVISAAELAHDAVRAAKPSSCSIA